METIETQKPPIELQAPGAGLPWVQHFVLRYFLFPIRTRFESWAAVDERIEREIGKILKLLDSVPKDRLSKKVLIQPIPGLEDSSRFWSVAETLEHLIIVGNGQLNIMRSLSQGTRPELEINIAAVKPTGKKNALKMPEEFRQFTNLLLSEMKSTHWNQDSRVKQNHPWFCEIGIKQWHWLVAAHFWIHRQQLKQIISLGRSH